MIVPGKFLWVDDMRPAPPGWDWATNFHQAISMLERGDYEVVSLDHDLGSFYGTKEMTGMDILNWLANRQYNAICIPSGIRVHTQNAAAIQKMKATAHRLMTKEIESRGFR